MLEQDMALTDVIIKGIRKLQYSGLYVKDNFSEGIEIQDVISDELRHKMVTSVIKMMTDVGSNKHAHLGNRVQLMWQNLEHIVEEITSSNSIIFNLIDIKQFDLYTYQHSVNVCILSCILGKTCNISSQHLLRLAWAAVLHDIGKMLIDKKIINKPGKLTPAEFEIIKTHSRLGFEWIRQKCRLPSTVAASVLQHHEKFDGSGYPSGKKESEIYLFAQIISVVDVYDAITSKRPYKEAVLPSEAYEYILGNSGLAFHPQVVEMFTKKIAPFPLGVQVQLSNGLKGIVYENYEDCLTRPLIKLYSKPMEPEAFIDLKNDTSAYNITIQKIFL